MCDPRGCPVTESITQSVVIGVLHGKPNKVQWIGKLHLVQNPTKKPKNHKKIQMDVGQKLNETLSFSTENN